MAKNAIITGGSRGIGKAMALKLGEKGYNVVINYRSDSSMALTEEVIDEIKEKVENAPEPKKKTTKKKVKEGLLTKNYLKRKHNIKTHYNLLMI